MRHSIRERVENTPGRFMFLYLTLIYLTDSKSDLYICPHILFMFSFLVSDELLRKSINTMQGNLKKLEKELETYKPLNDPDDQFVPVLKISF